MSTGRKGRPVFQIDINTKEIIKKFNSIKEAEQETGAKNISKVCNGGKNHKSSGGYNWKYADEEKKEITLEEKMESLKTNREKEFEEIHFKLLKKWNEDKNIIIGLVDKWNNAQITFSVKKRQFELIDNVITCTEICLGCNQRKPITPLYFNIEKTFNISCESGKESISNTRSQGCRECLKNYSKKRAETIEEYIRVLLKPYPKLDKDWYNKLPNKCAISNIDLIEKNNVDWRVSIQNNIPKNIENNIKNIKKGHDHIPEHCIKIAGEFNVQEHNTIKKDLVNTYKEEIFPAFLKELKQPSDTEELINIMKEWYKKSPKENGVFEPCQIEIDGKKIDNPEYSKKCQEKHLKRILQDQVNNYKKSDKDSKNIERHKNDVANITHEILYNKLIKQKMKCHYSGIPFSLLKENWNFWSLERVDNNKNHTVENTVMICRIFNGYSQLNRKKLLYALSHQIHVSLTDEIKFKIDDELKDYS